MFNFPPMNHFTFGSVKFHSKTLSHFFFHKKFSACSAQNCSGFATARLYSDWYCSKEVILDAMKRKLILPNVKKEIRLRSAEPSDFCQGPRSSGAGILSYLKDSA